MHRGQHYRLNGHSCLHELVEVLHLVAHSTYEWGIVNCVIILAYCN